MAGPTLDLARAGGILGFSLVLALVLTLGVTGCGETTLLPVMADSHVEPAIGDGLVRAR